MPKNINITIDGPSGAGKSSLARDIASHLGYIYVDTGALYRSIGYYVQEKGLDTKNEEHVGALLPEIEIALRHIDGLQHVYINGRDVSSYIRTQSVAQAASDVSAIPIVREFLLSTQRNIAANGNIVMDGRDAGTVILPNADVKIFLTASPESRAKRRYEELLQKGEKCSYDQILKEVNERDYNDSHRAISPLKQADDAILLDNTFLGLKGTHEAAMEIIKNKLGVN